MSNMNQGPPCSLVESQLWGFNGHQYLCDINIDDIITFDGFNYNEWAKTLEWKVGACHGAWLVLSGDYSSDHSHIREIRGLEHDLYDLVFRTIADHLTSYIHEYIAVKTHRLERRGSVVFAQLRQLYGAHLKANDNEGLHHIVEAENEDGDDSHDDTSSSPIYCSDNGISPSEIESTHATSAEQGESETLVNYARRIRQSYSRMEEWGFTHTEPHIIGDFIKGLRDMVDYEWAKGLLRYQPGISLDDLATSISLQTTRA